VNATLRTRTLRAGTAVAVAAVMAYGLWYAYDTMSREPVRRVIFSGDSAKLVRADLEALAESIRGLPASGESLAAIRDAARRIPWVREATVRRRFPDAVEIAFEAHEPLARWSDEALVSVRGEIFNAEFAGKLPQFRGAAGAASAMAREYPAIAQALAPVAKVDELRLSPRGAWEVVLDSGLVLALGRGDIHTRLARFVAAWPRLPDSARKSARADLRYGTGFALRLNPLPGPPPGVPPGARAGRQREKT
jgi:cell division protein FtsQ